MGIASKILDFEYKMKIISIFQPLEPPLPQGTKP